MGEEFVVRKGREFGGGVSGRGHGGKTFLDGRFGVGCLFGDGWRAVVIYHGVGLAFLRGFGRSCGSHDGDNQEGLMFLDIELMIIIFDGPLPYKETSNSGR